MPRRRRVAGLVLSTLLGVAAAGVLPAAPAHAAPVANDDRYDVVAGGTYTLNPLENDTSNLDVPFGDEFFCGIQSYDPQRVYVEATSSEATSPEATSSEVTVEVLAGPGGHTEITYSLCQDNQPTDTGTITLDVVRLADVRASKVRGVKGRVRFTNPNGGTVKVSWGSPRTGRPDATKPVGPRTSRTISTQRHSIYWVAFIRHEGATITLGDGVLRRLQQR